jgi:hypothetical protein
MQLMIETHNPSDVAFALITFYPKWYSGNLRSLKHTDKVRGDLALEFIAKARKRGYHIVVVDGKSSKTFLRELSQIDGIHLQKRKVKMRSPNKRQALRAASTIPGVKVLILTEAEKISLLIDCIDYIVQPILENEADIVVPKRRQDLFLKTYPKYMYDSEVEGNRIYNEALRTQGLLSSKNEDLDMFFGPRVLKNNKRSVALFMKQFQITVGRFSFPLEYFNAEEYSNALYFPVVMALRKRFLVKSVTVPFSYPQIQKENEEHGQRSEFIEKRKMQRLSLLVELLHFLSFLEGKRSSRMKVMNSL